MLKVAQINYVSRNQLHCTAHLNFGLICKKAKHCWALSTNFLILFSWQFFLIMFCFLLNWRKNSNYLKNSCMAKWFHETELQGIYLYVNKKIRVLEKPECIWLDFQRRPTATKNGKMLQIFQIWHSTWIQFINVIETQF